MTSDETIRLIRAAGGNQKFAELLGIEKEPWHKQRISNWKKRGIPSDVVLENFETFRKLTRKAS